MGDRVIVLGFDGVDFKYLDKFSDSLEKFSSVRDAGTEAPLRSTFPPMTPSAWPSLYTGSDPSHHGVFHFQDYPHCYPTKTETVDRTNVDAPAIWDYLSALDVPSVVLNVPMTHPADDINGVIVPGFPAREQTTGHPNGIRDEISEAIGQEYRIYPKSDSVEDYITTIDTRRLAMNYLLEEYDWEFSFIQVQKTDSVFHQMDSESDFRRVFEAADDLISDALDLLNEDDHLLICSDHGMDRTQGQRVFINEILHNMGYVGYEGDDGENSDNIGSKLATLGRSSAEYGYQFLQRLGLSQVLTAFLPQDEIKKRTRRTIDWEKSTAYCRSGTELGLRINLKGREPNGIVPEDQYEPVRSELIDILTDLRTPSGERVFEYVVRREELYEDGPHLESGCDILFMPFTKGHVVSHETYGLQFSDNITYEHRPNGILIGLSPAIDGWGNQTVPITSVAPTVMRLMGYDVPKQMSGTIPSALGMSEPRSEYRDVKYAIPESEGPSESVNERLEDLGYL